MKVNENELVFSESVNSRLTGFFVSQASFKKSVERCVQSFSKSTFGHFVKWRGRRKGKGTLVVLNRTVQFRTVGCGVTIIRIMTYTKCC